MKVRRLILLTLVFSLICGSAVYADSVSQKIRVWMNGKEVDDAGIIVDGKAYISVRSVTDKLQAMLSWDDDTKKVVIYKPNVHMILLQGDSMFGNVSKGKFKFNVYSQIDNLKVDITAFKVTISDPYGEETYIDGRNSSDKDFPEIGKEDFWFKSKEISYNFESVGKYTVSFWIKPAGESNFQVVSEKVIKR